MLLRKNVAILSILIEAFLGVNEQLAVAETASQTVLPQFPANYPAPDQDGFSICFAGTLANALYGLNPTRGYPSLIQLAAIQDDDPPDKFVTLDSKEKPRDNEYYFDGGELCTVFDKVKQKGGYCKKDEVLWDQLISADTSASHMYFEKIGEYFDAAKSASKNPQTKEQLRRYFDQFRAGIHQFLANKKRECQDPNTAPYSDFLNAFSGYVSELNNQLVTAKSSIESNKNELDSAQKKVAEVEAHLATASAQGTANALTWSEHKAEYEKLREKIEKKYPDLAQKNMLFFNTLSPMENLEELNPKLYAKIKTEWDYYDKTIDSNNEIMRDKGALKLAYSKAEPLATIVAKSEQLISDTEKFLKENGQMVTESPSGRVFFTPSASFIQKLDVHYKSTLATMGENPTSTRVEATTKQVLKTLEAPALPSWYSLGTYNEAIKSDYRRGIPELCSQDAGQMAFLELGASQEAFDQMVLTDGKTCQMMNLSGSVGDIHARAYEIIIGAQKFVDSPEDMEKMIDAMTDASLGASDYLNGIVSGDCLENKVSIPEELKCNSVMFSPKSASDPERTSYASEKKKLAEAVERNLRANKPIMVSVCYMMMYDAHFDSNRSEKGCKEKDGSEGGGHGLNIIGSKVDETGKKHYLIQNSWGPGAYANMPEEYSVQGSHSSASGQLWIPEDSLVSNIWGYYEFTNDYTNE